jgi:hypothetical protein
MCSIQKIVAEVIKQQHAASQRNEAIKMEWKLQDAQEDYIVLIHFSSISFAIMLLKCY